MGINENIADDLSRKIYMHREKFSKTHSNDEIEDILHLCWDNLKCNDKIKQFGEKLKNIDGTVYLFGCGNYSKVCIYMWPSIRWKLIDNYYGKEHFMGRYEVINFETFRTEIREESIVISSKKYADEMKSQLMDIGIDNERILECTFLFDLIEGKQYFDLKELHPVDREIFVDAGAYDAGTSLEFMEWCQGKYDKIYCFEPDLINLDRIRKKVVNIDKLELINKGLWDRETVLSFASSGSGMSKIIEDCRDSKVNNMIKVTSLDTELKDIPVSFIKMDIEGAELKALEGAKEIIKKYKPKLAICVYHKAEDIYTIPEFVLSLHPNYKLYFRHYGFTESETVMYAI